MISTLLMYVKTEAEKDRAREGEIQRNNIFYADL